MWENAQTRVFAVAGVDLRLTDGVWVFAEQHREDIADHWARRLRETPGFFNGAVHVLTAHTVSDGVLSAQFVRTDFKSFLYWRETGWPDTSVMDAFGSALILSAEGHVLLGHQSAGHLNSGFWYPPGGFIDARDVGADGVIDIEGSVAREIAEETGLGVPAIRRGSGYVVTIVGPVLSIAVPYHSVLTGAALLTEAARHLSADGDSELSDLMLVDPGNPTAGIAMPEYARALLTHLAA